MPSQHGWVCYIVQSSSSRRKTYVGITNNLKRRLRQHNGVIKGGAKATRGKGPWQLAALVKEFESKSHAMQFEWRMHHPRSPKYRGSLKKRLRCARHFLRTMKKQFSAQKLYTI